MKLVKMTLTDETGKTYEFPVVAKQFQSGSVGFWTGGKLNVSFDERYQIGLNATLIGSKPSK